VHAKIADWDRRVLLRIYNIQNVYLTRLFKIVSHIGSTPFWVAVGLVAFIPGLIFHVAFPAYLDLGDFLIHFCAQLFTAFIVSGSVLIPAKYVIYRQRPHQKFRDIPSRDYYVTDPSMPSGHCAQWILYGWVVSVYLLGNWYMILVLATLPLIIVSRIYLGSHFPSDTLVGVFLGVVIVGILLLVTPLFEAWYTWGTETFRIWVPQLFGG
jgi:membrane-associated phospholipid phosphatase